MARSKKPSVNISCYADRYSATGERIVEYTFPSGLGGLISFMQRPDGSVSVDLYRHDPQVVIRVGKANGETPDETPGTEEAHDADHTEE